MGKRSAGAVWFTDLPQFGCDWVLCDSSAKGLHSASIPGILALDLCPSDTNKILTGESGPGPTGQGEGWQEQGRRKSLVLCMDLRTERPSLAPGSCDSFFFSFLEHLQVEQIKTLLSLIRVLSKFWPLSKAIPRRSPAWCFILLR